MWLADELELPAVDLAEARLAALVALLAHHGGVERGVRRLAAGAGPQVLFGHRGDQFLGVHGLAGLLQNRCGGVEGADALGLLLARRLDLGRGGLRLALGPGATWAMWFQ